ncbi:hypothetical protein [Lacticaseibacillus kribbianus]|uniref:hypothetical protein n=1 Tax=Lacticaseibacillus kribbianus TaxID=2926292 RepID=UPI001CD709EC|nr:hypothetical protein [Lacticaseibacillus kribbianus]
MVRKITGTVLALALLAALALTTSWPLRMAVACALLVAIWWPEKEITNEYESNQ